VTQQIPCPRCGKLNDETLTFCLNCGHKFQVQQVGSLPIQQVGSQSTSATTLPPKPSFHKLRPTAKVSLPVQSQSASLTPNFWGLIRLLPWWMKAAWLLWIISGIVLLILTIHSASNRVTSIKEREEPKPTPAPTVVPTPSEVEVGTTSTGTDEQGNEVTFDIYLLTKNFAWKHLSTTDVESLASPNGKDIFSAAMQQKLQEALGVICAGTASSDGNRKTEEERASSRARTITQWVKDVRGSDENVDPLNLGQYVPQNTGVSMSDQRRVIVITITGIVRKQGDYNKEQALKDALKKKQGEYPIFRSMLEDYSSFYIR